jgi:hypothetical protein
MADSSASLNGTHGVVGKSGPGYVLVRLSHANLVGNAQFGMLGDGTAGNLTEMVVGNNSLITNNLGGSHQAVGGALLYSNGNNEILFQGPGGLPAILPKVGLGALMSPRAVPSTASRVT